MLACPAGVGVPGCRGASWGWGGMRRPGVSGRGAGGGGFWGTHTILGGGGSNTRQFVIEFK